MCVCVCVGVGVGVCVCVCVQKVLVCVAAYICDRICEKGPLRGNVNIWVRDKARAKPSIHAIADYCIIGRYCVSPIFWPSLKPVRLSCVSNEDRIVSFATFDFTFCAHVLYTMPAVSRSLSSDIQFLARC